MALLVVPPPSAWAFALLVALSSPGWVARAQPVAEGASCPTGNFTAADCPNSNCYAAEPNGCGSRSLTIISDKIVPDQWPAGVDFTEACNMHDLCYFTPRAAKAACDDGFHQALLQECDRALRCADVPILGRQCFSSASQNPLFGACTGLADTYYKAVATVAEGPFQQDQEVAGAHADQCAATAARGCA